MPNNFRTNELLTDERLNELCEDNGNKWSDTDGINAVITMFEQKDKGGKGLYESTVRYFLRKTRNKNTSDDLAQSFFLSVAESYKKFDCSRRESSIPLERFKAFIISRRFYFLKNYWKEVQKDKNKVSHTSDNEDNQNIKDHKLSPEDNIYTQELIPKLTELSQITEGHIKRLPQEQKVAIELVDWDLVPQKQAAMQWNVTSRKRLPEHLTNAEEEKRIHDAFRKNLFEARRKMISCLNEIGLDYTRIRKAWKEYNDPR